MENSLLFFGGSYEVRQDLAAAATTTKAYYAIGGQMIAVRTVSAAASALDYILTDHLGSTSVILDETGTLINQQRFLPFGQPRADVPTPFAAPTDFGYTGQRLLDPSLGGLMDYKARFYSPHLSRFIQPDTLIPGAGDPQAWNRYAYVNNSPVRYNDPSGHCPIWASGGLVMGIWCGNLPDYRGVASSMIITSDSRIAAALAVQSQWLGPQDYHIAYPLLWIKAKLSGGGSPYSSSGFGMGQITDEEMDEFGLWRGSQELPWVAAKAMGMRIDKVLAACEKLTCSAIDKLIATALAQNGGFHQQDFRDLLRKARGGDVDWESYFDKREAAGGYGGVLGFRAEGYGKGRGGFDTRFMVQLYINDLLLLEKWGYKLPYGLTREQLINIRSKYNNYE